MKPEISEEIISGWRREFESQDSFEMHFSKRKNDNGEYSDDETYFTWIGYLVARKKAHSEREDAFKAFTLDLADRYEKKIELLKAELKAANKIIEVLENPNNWGNHKGIDCYLYNQALAEVEKIRSGGEG